MKKEKAIIAILTNALSEQKGKVDIKELISTVAGTYTVEGNKITKQGKREGNNAR